MAPGSVPPWCAASPPIAARRGGTSLFAWVLKDNPNRAFYERLGARAVGEGRVGVGRESLDQVAYRWDDLVTLSDFGAST